MPRRRLRTWFATLLIVPCISVSQVQAVQEDLRHGDHPLVGQIWSGGAQSDRHEALARMARADVVLLGESHGNADHHARQLEILQALLALGRRPALAFEIFDLEDQEIIDRQRLAGVADADDLAEAVGLTGRGWVWAEYRPLVQFALDQALPIVATNLSRRGAMAVAMEGLESLPGEDRARLGLDRPLPEDAMQRLERRIVDAHCGHLPAARAGGMINAQRARDAYMADRIAAQEGPVVLITGAAHARLDYGVPWYLEQQAPDRQVLSLMFVEVDPERQAAVDYLNAGGSPHHLFWFTRRNSPDDPCEAFRKQLEGMRG
ncbi:ChaN family lipoprotein [Thioalkalivibrio sulfidiphilus]|uniref:ChaN family lipoprotein n=1 Tax=Thioalkalivibrio sulfidiphilus TaxID=1033854 RepID=UPI0003708D20|nr:ChaN family lipoprotein [Thioalkalivibrio sulfidiphilus]